MEIKLSDPFAAELLKTRTALMQVIDPELCVNIVDLGFIYGVDFTDAAKVKVTMTLTTPGSHMGGTVVEWVNNVLGAALPWRAFEQHNEWDQA